MKKKGKITIGAILIVALLASTALLSAANTSGDVSEQVSINKERYAAHRSISQQPTSNALTEKIVNKTYTPTNEIFLIRNFTESISIEEIKEKREKIINNFVNAMGKPEHAIAIATPEVPEGARIVAYGFRIYPNGVTTQYVGMAGDEESVQIIHEHAQEWYDKYVIIRSGAYWSEISRGEADFYKSPYGGVTNNFECRYLYNDNSNTRNWYAIKHIFAMEPGCQRYGSGWKNYRGYPKHDWSASTLGNPQLHEWDLLGTHTGSQTIAVSITGGTEGASVTWSWGYTQPDVTTIDQSSTDTEIAKWEEHFNNGAVQSSTGGMKPGSCCAVNQHTSGTYRLLDLTSEGKFKNWPYYYILELTNQIDITYS